MRKPLIGINCDFDAEAQRAWIHPHYYKSIQEAGGVAVLIPPQRDHSEISGILAALDGVLFTGGNDICPSLYGEEKHAETNVMAEERLNFDIAFAQEVLRRGMPCMGICLGCQLIHVAAGGRLIQDIPSEVPNALQHRNAFHIIRLASGSRIAQILGSDEVEVNSYHHQAVPEPTNDFVATAWAPDNVIECIESKGSIFQLGVQWHPERITDRPEQRALFRAFVEACAESKQVVSLTSSACDRVSSRGTSLLLSKENP